MVTNTNKSLQTKSQSIIKTQVIIQSHNQMYYHQSQCFQSIKENKLVRREEEGESIQIKNCLKALVVCLLVNCLRLFTDCLRLFLLCICLILYNCCIFTTISHNKLFNSHLKQIKCYEIKYMNSCCISVKI